MIIKIFKAQKQTKRFNKNQKVWITKEFENHLYVRFKYRGKGRYVNGILDKFNKVGDNYNDIIGKDGFKEIDISENFYNNIMNNSINKGRVKPTLIKVKETIENLKLYL